MKIGIVSDSHGKSARLGRALAMLIDQGAEAVLHCGDLGNAECLRTLAAAGVPAYAVAGNMDRHSPHLGEIAAGGGVGFGYMTVEIDLGDDQHLIATHGDDGQLADELIRGGQFPVVCLGHTHRRLDTHVGDVHVVNPGAINYANPPSAALLDTETDQAAFIEGF